LVRDLKPSGITNRTNPRRPNLPTLLTYSDNTCHVVLSKWPTLAILLGLEDRVRGRPHMRGNEYTTLATPRPLLK